MTKKKSEQTNITQTVFENLLKYDITPIDLFILSKLNENTDRETLYALVKDEFNIKKDPKTVVNESIEKMKKSLNGDKDKIILLKEHAIIVDPTLLYDHVYIAFIKVHLPSFLGSLKADSWKDLFKKIIEINKEHGSPIKILFNVGGMGEYDFIAFIYTNELEKYHEFKSKVVEKGFIEKFDTKYVERKGGFYFDPISIPSYEVFKRFVKDYSIVLENMKHQIEKEKSVKTEKAR